MFFYIYVKIKVSKMNSLSPFMANAAILAKTVVLTNIALGENIIKKIK